MATEHWCIEFKNATIDYNNNTIHEITEDGEVVYKITDLFKKLNNIDGLTISFFKNAKYNPVKGLEDVI